VSVGLSVTCLCPAKAATLVEVLFGVETPEGPRNIVLDEFNVAFTRLLWPLVLHMCVPHVVCQQPGAADMTNDM